MHIINANVVRGHSYDNNNLRYQLLTRIGGEDCINDFQNEHTYALMTLSY